MSGRPRKTDRAERDIDEIANRIAADNETAALKWLEELDQKLTVIATMPGIGTARSDLQRGIRSYAFGDYLIFFKVTRTGVDIIRVIHGARDYKEFFK